MDKIQIVASLTTHVVQAAGWCHDGDVSSKRLTSTCWCKRMLRKSELRRTSTPCSLVPMSAGTQDPKSEGPTSMQDQDTEKKTKTRT